MTHSKTLVLVLSSIFCLCFSSFLEADTVIPDGYSTSENETWALEASPYLVNGAVTVPEGSTLTIQPGVIVQLKTGSDYDYSDGAVDVGFLDVQGKLVAQGTEENSILFTRQGEEGYWGIVFLNETADSEGVVEYCKFEYGSYINYWWHSNGVREGALSIDAIAFSVSNCDFKQNEVNGLFCFYTEFAGNNLHAENNGGSGFFTEQGSFTLRDSSLIGNGENGFEYDNSGSVNNDGVFEFIRCDLSQNDNYGAYVQYGADTLFENCNISNNSNIGLAVYNTDTDVVGCKITRNFGKGISANNAHDDEKDTLVASCTIAGNSDTGVIFFGELRMVNSILWGNGDSMNQMPEMEYCFIDSVPENYRLSGEGNHVGVDPLFIDAEAGDYSLSLQSPAVDAGSMVVVDFEFSDSDLDGNTRIVGTEIDLGAYEKQGPYLVLVTPFTGQTLIENQELELRWKSSLSGNYDLEYSIDSGVSWVSIVSSASGYEYLWDVPGLLPGDLTVRITSLDFPDIHNEIEVSYAESIPYEAQLAGIFGAEGSPHIVDRRFTVPQMQSMSVEAGTEFQFIAFPEWTFDHAVEVNGCFQVFGSASEPVVFKGEDDGLWNGILFTETSYDLFVSHSAFENGEVYLRGCELEIENCEFRNHDYTSLLVRENAYLYASGCVFVENATALSIVQGEAVVVNSLFYSNELGLYLNSGQLECFNSIFWANDSYTEDDSVIYENCLVEEDPDWVDPDNGDFSLLPTSYCIDNGGALPEGDELPNTDFLGSPRVVGSQVDIGPIEFDGAYLRLTSPNGREAWFGDAQRQITWDTNQTGSVSLEYSTDGGTIWSSIVESTDNDGAYDWLVPDIVERSVLVRISFLSGDSIVDQSNEAFYLGCIPDGAHLSGVLDLAHSPYHVEGEAIIEEGNILSIEAGVEIRFQIGSEFTYEDEGFDPGHLMVEGHLEAVGTATSPIRFTRDGESGYWGSVFLNGADGSVLNYCEMDHGGILGDLLESNRSHAALVIYDAQAEISNCVVKDSLQDGLSVSFSGYGNESTSVGRIENTVFLRCHGAGLNLWNVGIFQIVNCNFIHNLYGLVDNSGLYDKDVEVLNSIFIDNTQLFERGSSYALMEGYSFLNCLLDDGMMPYGLYGYSLSDLADGPIYLCQDPGFVNPDEDDFRLLSSSPCIDRGSNDSWEDIPSAIDISGVARSVGESCDIGAYEFSDNSGVFLRFVGSDTHKAYQVGQVIDLEWESLGAGSDVNLEYSVDGGDSWTSVAQVSGSSTYSWTVPETLTQEGLLRVTSIDSPELSDQSYRSFAIFQNTVPTDHSIHGHWTLEHSPYLIEGRAVIEEGEVLIIDPGVEVKFSTGDNRGYLHVRGGLVAEGTSEDMIRFTGNYDESYWGGLIFDDSEGSSLMYCQVEYASSIRDDELFAQGFPIYTEAGIYIFQSELDVSFVEVSNCLKDAIYINGFSLSYYYHYMEHLLLVDNGRNGVHLGNEASSVSLDLSYATIANNGAWGVFREAPNVSANHCIYWGNHAGSANHLYSYEHCLFSDEGPDYGTDYGGNLLNSYAGFIDPVAGDYHINPGSPVIDAGSATEAFNLEPSGGGGGVNLGYYGNTPDAALAGDQPIIGSLSRSASSVAGGQQVEIYGLNFGETQSSGQVLFGDAIATVSEWTDTRIVVETPAKENGKTDISVQADTGAIGTAKSQFEYFEMVNYVSGEVSGQWSPENGVYLLEDSITIPSGDTLEVLAGTQIFVDPRAAGSNAEIIVSGKLDVLGSEENPVVFSVIDGFRKPGAWAGINVEGYSYSNIYGVIEGAVIEYAKLGISVGGGHTFPIRNSVIRYSSENGLYANNVVYLTLENVRIYENGQNGIEIYIRNGESLSCYPEISGCDISNNGADGINIWASAYTPSSTNYWNGTVRVYASIVDTIVSNNAGVGIYGKATGSRALYTGGYLSRHGLLEAGLEYSLINGNSGGAIVGENNDYGSYSGSLDHCTFFENGCPTIDWESVGLTIENSIIWNEDGKGRYARRDLINSTYSIWDCEMVLSGEGLIQGDPLMRNPYMGDFHLYADSPCIDAGYCPSGETCEYSGQAPDMGALEFNSDNISFEDWMAAFSSISGNELAFDADPDGDGLSNGLEFMIQGANPATFDANPFSQSLIRSSNGFSFSCPLRSEVIQNPIWVEFSNDMKNWTSDNPRPEQISVESTDSNLGVEVNGSLDRLFFRLNSESSE